MDRTRRTPGRAPARPLIGWLLVLLISSQALGGCVGPADTSTPTARATQNAAGPSATTEASLPATASMEQTPQGAIATDTPGESPQATEDISEATPGEQVADTPTPAPQVDNSPATETPTEADQAGSPTDIPAPPAVGADAHIKTVFVIVMENHNWSDIKGSPSAPYINTGLLPQASWAEQYYNPPGIHPSEPNYLWLEAGTNFGIADDSGPSSNHQGTTAHLVTLLNDRGISWKAYEEGISGKVCPLASTGSYAAKHNPMVFFDDVTGNNSRTSAYCIAHERPYTELAPDLANNSVARYNFVTPDLCHDMHNSAGCDSSDSVRNGDDWLSTQVPAILDSQAYKSGGALFVTWDEGEGRDGPIGMIVLSPYAKGGGYSDATHYTHSSTLRTFQEIFGMTPLLGDAANAPDLSALFSKFP